MSNRTPRNSATRESGERPKAWTRPSALAAPEPRNGVKFRWVRTSSMGVQDSMNVARRFREGYSPVELSAVPELKIESDFGSKFRGNVEVGGLLLCQIGVEAAQSRSDVQLDAAYSQMEAVDNALRGGEDSRMPLSVERKSKTTFGP